MPIIASAAATAAMAATCGLNQKPTFVNPAYASTPLEPMTGFYKYKVGALSSAGCKEREDLQKAISAKSAVDGHRSGGCPRRYPQKLTTLYPAWLQVLVSDTGQFGSG